MFSFFGHNCFVFETAQSTLITDPWLSNKGAFFGSWFQYPKNHHLKEEALSRLREKKPFIYITHEHLDHFDPEFLSNTPRETTIIIPAFRDKYLLQKLQDMGLNAVEIAHGDTIKIDDDLCIKVFVSDVGINHDSAVLIKHADFTFLNQNDCKIFDTLSAISEKIDFYSVQFSGATGHPACFSYGSEEKSRISKTKSAAKLNNVKKGIDILSPKYFIPAAGPAIFPHLDPSLSFGKDNIFIHQDRLKSFFQEHGINNAVYMRPGDRFSDNKTIPVPPPSQQEFDAYKETVANIWQDIDVPFSPSLLKGAVDDRLEQIKDLSFDPCPIMYFCWGKQDTQALSIDLNNKKSSFGLIESNSFIKISGEEKYFALMHSDYRWQDIYLSLRCSISRNPDIFSNFANIFLFSDVSNIRNAFKSTIDIPAERIKITTPKGDRYEIDRYCPHQGGDLCNAVVDNDDNLVCPRHGWKFSLDKGGINQQSGKTINANKLET